MIRFEHRSTTARATHAWDFCSARRVVDLVLHVGTTDPIAIVVPVCALDKPRVNAFEITRIDDGSWLILPSRVVVFGDILGHYETAIHPTIRKEVRVVLSGAPYAVDADMEALSL